MGVNEFFKAIRDCYVDKKDLDFNSGSLFFSGEDKQHVMSLACLESLKITRKDDELNFSGKIRNDLDIPGDTLHLMKQHKWVDDMNKKLTKQYNRILSGEWGDMEEEDNNKYRKLTSAEMSKLIRIEKGLKNLGYINSKIDVNECYGMVRAECEELEFDQTELEEMVKISQLAEEFDIVAVYDFSEDFSDESNEFVKAIRIQFNIPLRIEA